MMGRSANELRVVRDGNFGVDAEMTVVFADHDARRYRLDRLPHPIIVAIDVDREQTDISCHTVIGNEPIDVFPRNEGVLSLEIAGPVYAVTPDEADVLGTAIDYQPTPMVVGEQETGICLEIVLHSKLDEQRPVDGHSRDEILDDAVLSPLRENPEFGRSRIAAPLGQLPRLNPAQCLLYPTETLRNAAEPAE